MTDEMFEALRRKAIDVALNVSHLELLARRRDRKGIELELSLALIEQENFVFDLVTWFVPSVATAVMSEFDERRHHETLD